MRKLIALAVVICLACAACVFYLPTRTIYLSPPPDVLYDAAVVIVRDMGFTLTQKIRGGYFIARRPDPESGKVVLFQVSFIRQEGDTLARIGIKSSHKNLALQQTIRDEIEARLRAVNK